MIANIDFVKAKNVSAIFKRIVDDGPIARNEVAKRSGLAAGSVTRITRQLIDAGLIEEQEHQASERGRPAVSLIAKHDSVQILAARAGRTKFHLGLCDLAGNVLARDTLPMRANDEAQFTEQLINALQTFVATHQNKITRLAGIGITMPGLVNAEQGIWRYSPHIALNDLPLVEQVERAFGVRCKINNAIAAMALAEREMGLSKAVDNSLFVNVHNGVGAGMIFNGALYEGHSLAVGEIGHVQIDPNGARCYCGNRGCLETLVSEPLIEQQCRAQVAKGAVTQLTEDCEIDDICRAAVNGDDVAISVLQEAATHLGRAIAMSVNLIRPEMIILSGIITEAASVIDPIIQQAIATQSVTVGHQMTTAVVYSSLYQQPWLGGFTIVRKAILQDGWLMGLLCA